MLLLVFSIDYCHIVSSDVLFINALIYECVKSMQNMSPHMTEEYICIFVAVTCMHACLHCGRLLESSRQGQKVIRHPDITLHLPLICSVFLSIYFIRLLLIYV